MKAVKEYILEGLEKVRSDFNTVIVKFDEFQKLGIDEKDIFIFEAVKSVLINVLKLQENFIAFTHDNEPDFYIYIPNMETDELDSYCEALNQIKQIIELENGHDFKLVTDKYKLSVGNEVKVYEIVYNNEKIESNLARKFRDFQSYFSEINYYDDQSEYRIGYIDKVELKKIDMERIFNILEIRKVTLRQVFPITETNYYEEEYRVYDRINFINLSQLEYLGNSIEEIQVLLEIKKKFINHECFDRVIELGYIFTYNNNISVLSNCCNFNIESINNQYQKINFNFFTTWCDEYEERDMDKYLIYNDYLSRKEKPAIDDIYDSLELVADMWNLIVKKSCEKNKIPNKNFSYKDSYKRSTFEELDEFEELGDFEEELMNELDSLIYSGEVEKVIRDDYGLEVEKMIKPVFLKLGYNISMKGHEAAIEYYEDCCSIKEDIIKILKKLDIEIKEDKCIKINRKNTINQLELISKIKQIDTDDIDLFLENFIEKTYLKAVKNLYAQGDINGDVCIIYKSVVDAKHGFKRNEKHSEISVYYSGYSSEKIKCLEYLNDLFKCKCVIKYYNIERFNNDLKSQKDIVWAFKVKFHNEKSPYLKRKELVNFINEINHIHDGWYISFDGITARINKDMFNKHIADEKMIAELFNLYGINKIELF